MREHVALAVDSAGLLLIISSLWLLTHRRSMVGIFVAIMGVGTLAAMASLRALPSPTRQEMGESIDTLKEQLAQQIEKARSLEKENAGLEERLASVEAAKRKVEVEGFNRLMEVATGREFSIRAHQDDEWIEGQRGRYYLIRLQDARTGNAFVFPKGEYRLEANASAVRQAFGKFQSQVLANVPPGWTTRILLRGGATVDPLVSTGGPMGVEFGAVRYRRENAGGRYGAMTDPLPFPDQTTNRDLPLLRAGEFRLVLFGKEASDSFDLLHREPSGTSEGERTVDIVLYVKPN